MTARTLVAGTHVIDVVNTKDQLGRMPLEVAAPLAARLYTHTNQGDLSSELLGSALLGSRLHVHPAYMTKRDISCLVEVMFEGSEATMRAVMEDLGFKVVPTKEHFAVEFLQDGVVRKIETLEGQKLFGGSPDFPGIVFSATPVPTTYYQAVGSPIGLQLAATQFNELHTPGENVGHKIVRGRRLDIDDVTQIALVGSLPEVLRGRGVAVIEEAAAQRPGDSKWLKSFRGSVSKIVRGILQHPIHGKDPVIDSNIEALHVLNKRAAEIVRDAA